MGNITRNVAALLALLLCTLSVAFAQTTPQTLENNRVCLDPISGIGRGPYIDQARLSGVCVACSGSTSASALVDGNLSNFASFDLGASVVGGFRIGVRDSLQYYPAGNEAGFVIRFRRNGLLGLLDASLLSNLQVRTYRNGTLTETSSLTTSSSGILSANALGGGGQGKQVVSFVTTQPFDEVELVYTGAVSAGTLLDVYYAFEGPGTCPKDCTTPLVNRGGTSFTATSGQVSTAPSLTVLGNVVAVDGCALPANGSVSNAPNLIDTDTTNSATITAAVGLLCRRFLEVRSPATYPIGTEAGFVINANSGLLDATVLGGITVQTYNNGVLAQTISGTGLVGANVLGTSGTTQVGFVATAPFNSIRISLTGVSVLVNLNVYYAYVKTDADNDGVADCLDRCAGSDQLDADGDGIPDACDQNSANLTVTKSSNSATATVGSNVTFTINVQRTTGPNATGVVVRDTLPAGLTLVSFTATPGTVYTPATGLWTIGSFLSGTTAAASLSITAQVTETGVLANIAEIIRSFETDPNSTPGNGNPAEDDIASACVSVPIRFCEGGAVLLSAPDSYTAGVEWFRTFNGVTTSVATTPTFSASLSGSYSFTATGASGCVSGNCCPVILIVDPAPTPTLAASQSVVCAGAATTLSVTNPETGTTYLWSNGSISPTISVTPTVTTVYTVSATSGGGCSSIASITVVVNQPPVQAPIVAICGPAGSTGFNFVISPTTAGTSTQYFVTVGATAEQGPFNYGETRTFTNNTGSFSVSLRDATTGCTIALPVTAPVNCPTCPPRVCVPIRVARIN